MQRAQTEDGSLHDLFEKSYKDFLDLNLTLAQQDGGSLHALFEESNTHFHHVLRQAKLKFRDKLIKLAKKKIGIANVEHTAYTGDGINLIERIKQKHDQQLRLKRKPLLDTGKLLQDLFVQARNRNVWTLYVDYDIQENVLDNLVWLHLYEECGSTWNIQEVEKKMKESEE